MQRRGSEYTVIYFCHPDPESSFSSQGLLHFVNPSPTSIRKVEKCQTDSFSASFPNVCRHMICAQSDPPDSDFDLKDINR